jgi:hypothetical protein
MVRAILNGTKTQTRRIVTSESLITLHADGTPAKAQHRSPYGQPGDQLWVREEYYQRGHWEPVAGKTTKAGRQKWAFIPADEVVSFDAPDHFRKGRHHLDSQTIAWHSRRARFMPRFASRITLEITGIRVERLHDITGSECVKEGMPDADGSTIGEAKEWYRALWESINGQGSWDANHFVCVIEFNRI